MDRNQLVFDAFSVHRNFKMASYSRHFDFFVQSLSHLIFHNPSIQATATVTPKILCFFLRSQFNFHRSHNVIAHIFSHIKYIRTRVFQIESRVHSYSVKTALRVLFKITRTILCHLNEPCVQFSHPSDNPEIEEHSDRDTASRVVLYRVYLQWLKFYIQYTYNGCRLKDKTLLFGRLRSHFTSTQNAVRRGLRLDIQSYLCSKLLKYH